MKKSIYKNYASLIYAPDKRRSEADNEYKRNHSWNLKYVFSHLKGLKRNDGLDVGCGLGQNLYSMEHFGFRNVIGIDISDECIDFCKKKKFNVKKISAESHLEKNQNKYDLITIYHVVEHINKKEIIEMVNQMYKSLRKGGYLVINIPNGNNSISGMHDRYVDITHEILYTPESMREMLTLSGFDTNKILINEEVAYTPYSENIVQSVVKSILLPILTFIVDMIWNVFFISQGSSPRKNRPVLLSISRK